jgi:hypothetical protein
MGWVGCQWHNCVSFVCVIVSVHLVHLMAWERVRYRQRDTAYTIVAHKRVREASIPYCAEKNSQNQTNSESLAKYDMNCDQGRKPADFGAASSTNQA